MANKVYNRPHFSDMKLTPLQAIRNNCIDCYCGQSALIKSCPDIDCSLYRYRMGRNPARAGLGGKGADTATLQKARKVLSESRKSTLESPRKT